MKHPLDIINERLMSGYYDNLPPFTYSKDAAGICYLCGYCSKIDYDVAKAKYEQAIDYDVAKAIYEQINSKKEDIRPLMIL